MIIHNFDVEIHFRDGKCARVPLKMSESDGLIEQWTGSTESQGKYHAMVLFWRARSRDIKTLRIHLNLGNS